MTERPLQQPRLTDRRGGAADGCAMCRGSKNCVVAARRTEIGLAGVPLALARQCSPVMALTTHGTAWDVA